MKLPTKKLLLLILLLAPLQVAASGKSVDAAYDVLHRTIGEHADKFNLKLSTSSALDSYQVSVENNKVVVVASSSSALTRGAYDYLRNATASIISWSGSHINIPENLPVYSHAVQSPFKYRYYFNVVTHGYTTPYWDWPRWEKEIDWMAMHGLNMPLIPAAHEAILYRTFRKLGLTEEESLAYFSGPAHFPWNRMGNIGGWDGPPPLSFFDKKIELTHRMLDRMRALDMHPIVHSFAGFVPEGLGRIYPEEELRELGWGGFPDRVKILSPRSELFFKVGKLYIEEWEREFGRGEFYLADSFNEMDVPLSSDSKEAEAELAAYGRAVYQPIVSANPEAVWVMQGWTFPYHKDRSGKLFWTPERLQALMSKVPDDKLLVLDLANEYNALFWDIDYSWEMYQGFFGKQWIYSFIPNMGGKVPLNGVLDYYAKAPQDALNFDQKNKLVGFGFAPEGIENNEIIYELLADWGWRDTAIELDTWIPAYCRARYGACPEELLEAFDLLRVSALGSFTDHPRFNYQFRPGAGNATVHHSADFTQAVRSFLFVAEQLGGSDLYLYDAIELGAQLIGLHIDELLAEADNTFSLFGLNASEKRDKYQAAIDLMLTLDRLLASHPNHQLKNWVELARKYGDTEREKQYYESNAKRLITTWGGAVNEYSARSWSGLIAGYYAARWQYWLDAGQAGQEFDSLAWEERWISARWVNHSTPFDDPLDRLIKIVGEVSN